jgi:hypothetical protein
MLTKRNLLRGVAVSACAAMLPAGAAVPAAAVVPTLAEVIAAASVPLRWQLIGFFQQPDFPIDIVLPERHRLATDGWVVDQLVARGLLPKLRYTEVLMPPKTWSIDGFRLVPEAYHGPELPSFIVQRRLLRMDTEGDTTAKLYRCLGLVPADSAAAV